MAQKGKGRTIMTKERLLAFTDGVLAIVITIMVLELHPPHEANFEALRELVPVFLGYLLSFIYVGIYWSNHHHLFQLVERVNGAVLWANLARLFCLSLIPFTTAWLNEAHAETIPVALYGFSLLMPAIAYVVMQTVVVRAQGPGSALREALGNDVKGKISPFLYVAGIALSFAEPWAAIGFYVLVALIWLVPDRRMEPHRGTFVKVGDFISIKAALEAAIQVMQRSVAGWPGQARP